uniref:B-cell receptor CD22 n=1 Tax=Erpetoichthys calabaricus TaxID=27687 RepID=A0A8C4SXJ3_ERPCA
YIYMLGYLTFCPLLCFADVSEWGATYETMRICALKGSTVTINCTYRHPECVTVENQMWFYSPEKNNTFNVLQTTVYHTNEQKVSSSHSKRVQFLGNKTTKSCSIEIFNVSREDSGFYAFRFEGTNNWTQVPGIELTVEATAEKVKENDTVNLTCSMNCSLNSSIFSWFKNRQLLNESSEKLEIQKTSAKDHGSYWCRTGNISSTELHLNVEYAPKNAVIAGHPNSSIEEGDSVILNCTVAANPPCNYSWIKENTSCVGSGEQLHINKCNKSHTGSYYCEATNIHGMARSAHVHHQPLPCVFLVDFVSFRRKVFKLYFDFCPPQRYSFVTIPDTHSF